MLVSQQGSDVALQERPLKKATDCTNIISSHLLQVRSCHAGDMLNNLLNVVPELNEFANLHLKVAFNKDSSRVGPTEWQTLARLLHQNRKQYDAFMVVHGTDTMAYTASALSLMLLGFRKPIVMTGAMTSLSVATIVHSKLMLHGPAT